MSFFNRERNEAKCVKVKIRSRYSYTISGVYMVNSVFVPKGSLYSSSDEEAARKRRELRDKLLRGDEIKVSPSGAIVQDNNNPNQPAIVIPKGKLASTFYWYENDTQLLDEEMKAMQRFFPQFELDKLSDKRLYWRGTIYSDLQAGGSHWYLQVIYDHNHPHNNTFGGSIKVYSINPNLEEIQEKLGEPIPHTLRDGNSHLYICTARHEDIRVGRVSTSAASAVSFAVKWISAFELWMSGDLSTNQFGAHNGI